MVMRVSRPAIALTAAFMAFTVAIGVARQTPADDARLKKLDAGTKVIDVSQYPADQQKTYKLFQTKCSKCHLVSRGVNTEMVLPGDWERYIKRMMYKPNSGMSSTEGQALYRFLAYDASVRKVELLRKALGALPAADRAAAIEKIKGINPGFIAP